MLDDKLAATDWEATQDELIQQIARESYLQWLCENSQSKKEEKTVGRNSTRGFFSSSYLSHVDNDCISRLLKQIHRRQLRIVMKVN